MKTHKWIFAIAMASLVWVACDEDEDNPLNKPDLPQADETFVEFAARSNMGEIEFGELAVTKATDSLVKAFAQEMVDAHNTAQNELEDIADDYGDVEWPNQLNEEQDSIKAQLDNATGYSFDTLYMRTQMVLHQGAEHNFQIGATSSTEARVKAYANKYLPKIQMHREKADSVHAAVIANNNTTVDGTTDGGTTDGTTDGGTTDGGTDDGTN